MPGFIPFDRIESDKLFMHASTSFSLGLGPNIKAVGNAFTFRDPQSPHAVIYPSSIRPTLDMILLRIGPPSVSLFICGIKT